VGQIPKISGAFPDFRDNKFTLEDADTAGDLEKSVRNVCPAGPVHQQDCAALVVELPLALENNVLDTYTLD
jgi:hypothetical protein